MEPAEFNGSILTIGTQCDSPPLCLVLLGGLGMGEGYGIVCSQPRIRGRKPPLHFSAVLTAYSVWCWPTSVLAPANPSEGSTACLIAIKGFESHFSSMNKKGGGKKRGVIRRCLDVEFQFD